MAERRYTTPVRDRRAARTREAILLALAEEVAAEGVSEISVQQVADRAGVAHRTVYRHFPDREALLDALGDWVHELLSRGLDEDAVTEPGDLLAAVPWVFSRFDDLGAPAAAMVRVSVAEDARSDAHLERTERLRALLEPALAGLGEDPEAVFAVLRHLLSAVTWWVGHAEFGLDGERTGRAVATVIGAVLAEARRTAD